ncbi:hypothetical protein AOQ84DRAFT_436305, partial [Glonium stellatum]
MGPTPGCKPSLTPTVLRPLTLPALLTHLVSQPTPRQTTLIVCNTRSAFLTSLLASLNPASQSSDLEQENPNQPLLPPTLRTLLTSRYTRLAFCASVPALQAYLAAYNGPAGATDITRKEHCNEDEGAGGGRQHGAEEPDAGPPTLLLLNPLALLAPTPALSAQGLGRLVAAAVEAAGR